MRISPVGILTVLVTGCAVGVALAPTTAVAQSHLPPCQADSNPVLRGIFGVWGERVDCVGDFSFFNGDRYVGEVRGSDGRKNGRGTYTNNDGRKYVGEFRDGERNGQGTMTWPSGQKYVGEWRDDKRNGQGALTLKNGDKYVGEFKDDVYDGQGTYTSADGKTWTGLWREDKFVKANSGPTGIPIGIEGGTFIVPVTIGQITLNFTIDSGAADVAVPADVVLTLIRTGSITKQDFLGEKQYVLADGSTVPSPVFVIRSIKVGDRVLQDVRATVTSVNGGLLLGQSFLNRFNSWSVDNKNRLLFLN